MLFAFHTLEANLDNRVFQAVLVRISKEASKEASKKTDQELDRPSAF
jgi:hypothetical protein